VENSPIYTFKQMLLGDVIDVIHSAKSNRMYLVIDPYLGGIGSHHFLLPLLCPVCGEPWHFIWNESPEKLASTLRDALELFVLVEVRFWPKTSARNIAGVMQALSLGSGPFEVMIENAADHILENDVFPAFTLALEQHVASTFPSPIELRAMTPDEARELLDLDEQESIEDAIRDVEEWMASDDYEDFDVDDDLYLAVHPNAVLDAIVVFPNYESDEPENYPYQAAIANAEEDEDKDDEFKGLESLDLGEDDDNNKKKNIR
jgi:hypothetical protein